MNWDWEKLTEQKQRRGGGRRPQDDDGGNGGGGGGPNGLNDLFEKFRNFRPSGGGKLIILLVIIVWALTGIYIVEPDETGVVLRFGEFSRYTTSGPHYHLPYPIERVYTPKVTQVQSIEVGFRTPGRSTGNYNPSNARLVPDESLMLTGDENIINVQFIVQFKIKDAMNYLFNVVNPTETVHNAAEAAMREVIGKNKIDSALTAGKLQIQQECQLLLQEILDRYKVGLHVLSVQLQDVHPPDEVVDAFKDVASAREDRSRIINEAEAYSNDILPKARGQAAAIVNEAQAYKESEVLGAKAGAARFEAVLEEYVKAPDVTRKRYFIETMEDILSKDGAKKMILSDEAAKRALPYLPLGQGAQGVAR
ncbi:FtsH protease activity modulator HflK [Desulfohalovibrio reitneri]|uniref:FtsH protease activity modulator HflK n=1 Tax=Desulfohalovibrio reitneri TaxID=1307759 RepID=UPI0004A6D3A4|nr:FtsH protease activity modulator HflK [Desulfohalovibrio reitneri]